MGPEIVLAWLIATLFVAGRATTDFISVVKGETPPSLVRGGRAFELASQWQANRKARQADPGGGKTESEPAKSHHLWELWCAIWRDRWIDAKKAHDRRVELRRERHERLWAEEREWSLLMRWVRSTLTRLATRYDAAWQRLAKRYARTGHADPGTPNDGDPLPEKKNPGPIPQDGEQPQDTQSPDAETATDTPPQIEPPPEARTSEPTDPTPQPTATPHTGDAVNGEPSNETTNGRNPEMPNTNGGTQPTKAGVLALVSRLENGVTPLHGGTVARIGGAGETAGLDAKLAFVQGHSGELFDWMNEFLLFANDLARAEYGPETQTTAILTAEKLGEAKQLVSQLQVLLAQAANVRDVYASYGWEPGSKQDLMT